MAKQKTQLVNIAISEADAALTVMRSFIDELPESTGREKMQELYATARSALTQARNYVSDARSAAQLAVDIL